MKLNTLLLTSAATLMATSVAFAADLPSKKAAPASGSVQVCKVGGMTGWMLPGSDTCVNLGGWVRANYSYNANAKSDDGKLDWNAWGGSYRVQTDVRSNTEVGVVRGVFRVTDGAMDKAYIQFAGLTAGKKDSLADIFGTNSIAFGGWSQGADGIDYKLSAGGLTFGIGAETPVNNNDALNSATFDGEHYQPIVGAWDPATDNYLPIFSKTAVSGDRPDLVAHLSGSTGPVSFALAAVSHEAVAVDHYDTEWAYPAYPDSLDGTTQGYAVLGRIGVTMNNVNAYGWGGMAKNASGYIGGAAAHPFYDFEGGENLKSSVWGLGATFTQGKVLVGAEYAQYKHDLGEDSSSTTDLAVFATYTVAKNLSVTGEYYQSRSDVDGASVSSKDLDTYYLRIQRDF